MQAPQSLLVQSHIDKRHKQGDGWGVGWMSKGHPQLFRSPRPLYRDRKQLEQATRHAHGSLLVSHVRWASNPLKLPRHELIGLTHTQPFQHGPWLFVHNGTLYIPREVKSQLGPWAKYVKGKNDSEVLFYWLLRTVVHAGRKKNWRSAIRDSFKELDKIWQRCKSHYPLFKYPYHGLNWVLTDGRLLLAFCYVDPRGWDKAKALCDRKQPYYQLQVQRTEHTIAVASEPLTFENNWQPMRHGQLLIAKRQGRHIAVQYQQVK